MAAASAAGGAPFSVTAEGTHPFAEHSGGASVTFSSVDLGDDTSDTKHVILAFSWGGDATAFSSCTIAGASATKLVETAGAVGTQRTVIVVAETTATTGDIVFTQASGSFTAAVFQVFQMINGEFIANDTISNSDDPSTGTINIPDGGFCVGIMGANTSATVAWTGLTEEYDRGTNAAYSFAYDMEMSAELARTVTANPSGSPTQRSLSVASFGQDATVSYESTAVDTTDQSSPYTFSSQGIGAAADNRTVVVVTIAHINSGTISAVTIGGNSATEIVNLDAGGAGAEEQVAMWAYDLTTGTTADIVVTCGPSNRMQIGTWALYGVGAPSSTIEDTTAPLSKSITIEAGGVAVAGSVNNASGSTVTSWGSDFKERYDTAVEPHTKASGADSVGGGSKTVSVTWSSAGPNDGLIAAAWPKG